MASFDLFIGIDYSGAETPESRLKALQVYAARPGGAIERLPSPAVSKSGRPCNWSRAEIAELLLQQAQEGTRFLVGIDHGFSFPLSYFRRYHLTTWPEFLSDFVRHWPTHEENVCVDFFRDGALALDGRPLPGQRVGRASELRLCERWTSSAKSVFQFDMQGSVAKSTHAGIPWLKYLRDHAGERIHFWPFDGWVPADGKAVVAEVYSAVFRSRYAREDRTPDEQDAFATAHWLGDMAARGALASYFTPRLTDLERSEAEREGWILGVL